MAHRQAWAWMVVITLACVVALFFCPLPQGSYSATHGPTSEMRALQSLLLMLGCLAGWALSRVAAAAVLLVADAPVMLPSMEIATPQQSPTCLRR